MLLPLLVPIHPTPSIIHCFLIAFLAGPCGFFHDRPSTADNVDYTSISLATRLSICLMLGSCGLLGMFDDPSVFAIRFGLSHHTHMFHLAGLFAAISMTAIFCSHMLDLCTLPVYMRFFLSLSSFGLFLFHFYSCTISGGLYTLDSILTRTYNLLFVLVLDFLLLSFVFPFSAECTYFDLPYGFFLAYIFFGDFFVTLHLCVI